MAEYIDRTALGICKANREIFKDPAYADGWNAVLEIIQSVPAADVAPVVHGHPVEKLRHRGGFVRRTGWDNMGELHTITCDERYTERSLYCPVCGKLMGGEFLHYCDNCGAKMDGDKP